MLRELAEDETFWVSVATVTPALLIAVVVEARDARERLDQFALEASRARMEALAKSEAELRAWTAAFERWKNKQGEKPGNVPTSQPIPQDDPTAEKSVESQGGRVAALLLALWALSFALFGSLVAALPVSYPGAIGDIGIVCTLAGLLLGTCGLIGATTSRILRG